MAVTKQTDVGALIAESIDRSYKSIGEAKRRTLRFTRRKAYFEWIRANLLSLFEAFDPDTAPGSRYAAHTEEGEFDDPRAGGQGFGSTSGAHPAYRAGYKTGWRAAKEGREADQDPTPKAPMGANDLKAYKDGYEGGYKKSGHAREVLQAHAAGDLDTADELTAKHFTGPSSAHHMPLGKNFSAPSQADQEMWNRWVGATQDPARTSVQGGHGLALDHVKKMINKIDQNIDLPDETGIEGLDYRKPPQQGKHHVNTAPHPADIGPHLTGKVKAGVVSKVKGGAMSGVTGADDPVKAAGDIFGGGGDKDVDLGGLDFGGEGSVKSGKHIHRGAGRGHKPGEEPSTGQLPGAEPAADSEPAAAADPNEHQRQSSPALLQQLHGEAMGDLRNAAFGPEAVQAHEGGAHNPAIAAFDERDFKPGQYHDALAHANDHWKNQWIQSMRQAQASGLTALKPKSYPITAPMPNGPEGKLGFVTRNPDGSAGAIIDPDSISYSARKHKNTLLHQEIDPVSLMEKSFNDPKGFGRAGIDPPDDDASGAQRFGQERADLHDGKGVHLSPDRAEGLRAVARHAKAKDDPKHPHFNPEIAAYQAERAEQGTNHPHHDPEVAAHRKVRADMAKAGWSAKRVVEIPGHEHYSGKTYSDGAGKESNVHPMFNGINNWLSRAKKAAHTLRDSGGRLIAGTEGPPDEEGNTKVIGDHPMLDYHRGHTDIQRELASGVSPENLQALSKLTQGAQTRVVGDRSAATNPNLARKTKEGEARYKAGEGGRRSQHAYVHSEAIAEAINLVLGTVYNWIQENVQVPEGRMSLVMEEIFSQIRPTYGHLFEVEGG